MVIPRIRATKKNATQLVHLAAACGLSVNKVGNVALSNGMNKTRKQLTVLKGK